MDQFLHTKIGDVPGKRKADHEGYEYVRRTLVSNESGGQCSISVYEIPPGKSAYPYHFHANNEEAFYILQGRGLLKTPLGERSVEAGDFLFFPANETGAHKLSNPSDSEALVYIDFDTHNEIDVAFYPDSGKIGVWGREINRLYKTDQHVDYYDGE